VSRHGGVRGAAAVIAFGVLLSAGPAGAQRTADDPALPEVPGASVELSWAEVRALIEQLTRFQLEGVEGRRRPPVDAIVHTATLRIAVGDGVLLVEGAVDSEVLINGWTTVPLFATPAALRSVTVAGATEPARLTTTPDGGIGLLLRDVGSQRIDLSYAVAVDPKMGPKSVAVPLPLAASVEVTFLADARVEDVEADGAVLVRSSGLRVERGDEGVVTQHVFAVRDPQAFVLRFVARRPLAGGGPTLEPAGPPGTGPEGPLAVVGPMPQEEPPRPVRYRAAASVDVAIDPAAVRSVVRIDLTIHDAPLEAITIDPLTGWELVKASLEGTDEPLRVETGEPGTVVRFPYPVEDRAVVTLLLEQTNERKLTTVTAPMISVHGAYRQEGEIGFRLDSTIEGTPGKVDGGGPVDPGEVRLPGEAVAQMAFRYHRVPYVVAMGLRYHEPRAVLTAAVERALLRVAATEDGKTVVDAGYLVRNSRHSYLALTLPRGAEPWGAFIDGRPVQVGQRADRPQVVLIALPRPEASPGVPAPFVVEVIYFARRDALDDFSGWLFELPKIDLPIATLDVEAYLPPTQNYTSVEGPLAFLGAVVSLPLSGWQEGNYRREGNGKDKTADQSVLANALWKGGDVVTRGALAARFELPEEGTLLHWHGAIFLPEEAVTVEATSRPTWFDHLIWWASAGLLLVVGGLIAGTLGAWAARQRKRGWTFFVLAVVGGAGAFGGSLFIPVASVYLVFVGFAIVGIGIGGMNLFRFFAGLRQQPVKDAG
jgi:hypothetical protein